MDKSKRFLEIGELRKSPNGKYIKIKEDVSLKVGDVLKFYPPSHYAEQQCKRGEITKDDLKRIKDALPDYLDANVLITRKKSCGNKSCRPKK